MDRLSDIPTQDTQLTKEEDDVIKKMFPTNSKSQTSQPGWIYTLKLAGISAALFILLANPWIDALFCKMPYCTDGGLTVLGIKSILFMLIWILLYKYLL